MFPLVEDPTKKIWYIAEKEVFKAPTFRPNLNVEQVGPDDIHLVQKCIDLFPGLIFYRVCRMYRYMILYNVTLNYSIYWDELDSLERLLLTVLWPG